MLSFFRKARIETPALSVVAPGGLDCTAEAPEQAIKPVSVPPADPEALRLPGRLSAAASSAGTSIGWLTHDSAQVADQARLIAAASEELAASTSEIAARSQTSAETAERAREGIAICAGDMRRAGERMQEIQAGTSEIGGRLDGFAAAARRIEEMATAIASISAQTNLLALNATIEAARAGEAGRGFAVVAGEVKALSGQTARATDEIRARLSALQTELSAMHAAVGHSRAAVAAGSEVMDRANARVEAESAAVAEAASEMRALAEVMEQQIAATGEIASNVGRIAAGTEKSRGEIKDAIGELEALEAMSRTLLDRLDGDPLAVALARLPADCAAWKRRLASVLVGVVPHTGMMAIVADPILPANVRAGVIAAAAQAAALCAGVKVQDWDAATVAFQAFDAATATTLAAAAAADAAVLAA
ncbi:Chromosome partition protein Smc [Methylobacterium cerastii]|uniref:Chromosome partition protein Smc n=2 Tax=Methylobacterium TaxID=407 RepID=A0ABQ4QHI7_9HYPH|nr:MULTISPECIES: methyl-accepting chemotaxis protein [Methylobacterium]TXM76018.1 chemotaxis protein [Methylobacterium sp. WL12]TXN83517.1 chemotaxis protein [Methylobacterium sp. WL8]GJD44499.1 Chromosome partition protein Smc [Methylobacterium cerastii]